MSGSKTGDSKSAAAKAGGRIRKTPTGEFKSKKQRAGELGRALRTVYDDTLREPVPDDFVNLLGKLT